MTDVRDNWERHWEEYAASAQENPAQAYRRRLVFSALDLPDCGAARILDIGSGQGDFAAALRAWRPNAQILGLELSQSGVDIAARKVPGARFARRDLLAYDPVPQEQRNWATHAVCSEVLEHLDDPERLLRNARAYMAPGCRLVVTVPGGPMSAFDRHIGHRRHFTASDLSGVLTAAGFSNVLITGAGFPFFNLYRCVVILRGRKLIEDVRAG
ncbi:MAG TPA: class I SAM-dependent methyltransferase, partial [Bryobacteraceae bacterium]|nr:class I SAM-dependent methyltransferase [Bryobacteraceae bacterium]